MTLIGSIVSGKILYAEAGPEFGDLLFSLLLKPAGLLMKFLDGKDESTGKSSFLSLFHSVNQLPPAVCSPAIADAVHWPKSKSPIVTPITILGCSMCPYAKATKGPSQSIFCPQSHAHSMRVGCQLSRVREEDWLAGYFKNNARFLVTDSLEILPLATTRDIRTTLEVMSLEETTSLRAMDVVMTKQQVP